MRLWYLLLFSAAVALPATVGQKPQRVAAPAPPTVQANAAKGNPALHITTASLPNAIAGQVYSASLLAAGGVPPYTWSISGGSLPPGLSLSTIGSVGSITGTPCGSVGTFYATFRVADSAGVYKRTGLSILVTSLPFVITTTTVPNNVVVGTPVLIQLQATGGIPFCP